MATERQIKANRANARKSTGPITPEGKRISSQNSRRHGLVSGDIVLKGENLRRFKELLLSLTREFQPRNSVERYLVQTMAVARWGLLRTWGIQTAGFNLEMARTRKSDPTAGTGATLAAVAFSKLASGPNILAQQHRDEVAYDRQFHRALEALLRMRRAESPTPYTDLHAMAAGSSSLWMDDSESKANSAPTPEMELTRDE